MEVPCVPTQKKSKYNQSKRIIVIQKNNVRVDKGNRPYNMTNRRTKNIIWTNYVHTTVQNHKRLYHRTIYRRPETTKQQAKKIIRKISILRSYTPYFMNVFQHHHLTFRQSLILYINPSCSLNRPNTLSSLCTCNYHFKKQ